MNHLDLDEKASNMLPYKGGSALGYTWGLGKFCDNFDVAVGGCSEKILAQSKTVKLLSDMNGKAVKRELSSWELSSID